MLPQAFFWCERKILTDFGSEKVKGEISVFTFCKYLPLNKILIDASEGEKCDFSLGMNAKNFRDFFFRCQRREKDKKLSEDFFFTF